MGLIALIITVLFAAPAAAHDGWINRGGFRSPAGEFCCGEGDCFEIRGVQHVTLPAPGWRLPSGEFVPETESQPSPDGAFWRCKKPDGTRRCFFAPEPAT